MSETEIVRTDNLHKSDVIRTPGDFESNPGPWRVVESDPVPFLKADGVYSLALIELDLPIQVNGSTVWECRK